MCTAGVTVCETIWRNRIKINQYRVPIRVLCLMANIPIAFLRADRSEPGLIAPSNLKWALRRPIVRMPVPFGSISESLGSGQKASAQKLVNTSKNAGPKEGKEERILISEVI